VGVAHAAAEDAERLTVEQRHTKCSAAPPPGVPEPVPLPADSRADSSRCASRPNSAADSPSTPPNRGAVREFERVRRSIAAITFALLVFGTASTVKGGLQLVLARQSKPLLRIMIIIAILFVVAGVIASIVLGRPIGRVGQ